jgi:hypothetical protein
MGDVGGILLLAFGAMLNPTLLAAVTLMMLLENPKRLMLGYLLGAYLTSISLGMLIAFSLHGSSGVGTARDSLTPAEDVVFGVLAIVLGAVLRTEWLAQRRERRRRQHEGEVKKESLPQRLLGRGSARIAFVVGAALTLPGASYLVALSEIAKLGAPTLGTAVLVVAFCLIQLLLLEVPLIGYALAPAGTEAAVARFRTWLTANGLRIAAKGLILIGVLLLIRAAIELLTA